MIYHVTIKWALIRICREVRPLLCYRQERTSELLLPRPGLCSHSSSKACRLLTMLVCILPRVLEACMYALSVDRPQNTINGSSEMRLVSVALLLCLCLNSGASVCWLAPSCRVYPCFSLVFYCARDILAWLCQVRVNCSS